MRIAFNDRKPYFIAAALVVLVFGARAALAQFTAPTCTPPNCSPAVIQNIPIASAGQNASINVTGDVKVGATFQTGDASPVLSSAGANLIYGRASASSSAGSLMLIQLGAVDRFRLSLAGDLTIPGTLTAGAIANVPLLNASNSFSGVSNSFSGMTSLGSAALVLSGAQNLIYGNIDSTSTGSLMLLQNESVDRFRVAANGNVTISGSLTVSGQAVCLSSGSGCPASSGMGGSGSVNYMAKFTAGTTLGNSQIQDNGIYIGIGGAPVNGYKTYTYGDSYTSGTVYSPVIYATSYAYAPTVYATGGQFSSWVTVNGQNVCLANGVNCPASSGLTGSGSTNVVAKFTSGTSLGNSIIFDDGSTVTVAGTLAAVTNLTVAGVNVCRQNGVNCPASGGVSSVSGVGAGISVSPTTGAVVVQNTGVTSLIAGAGISLNAGTGAVTITNTASAGIGGSGSVNSIPKFTAGTTLGNSIITDNGATVSIGGSLSAFDGGFSGTVTATNGTFSGNVTVAGSSVCRQNGTNCPASSEVDTLNTVVARGNTTGLSAQFGSLGAGANPVGGWGIQAYGSSIGVYANGGSYGLYATSSGYPIYAPSGNSYIYGLQGNTFQANTVIGVTVNVTGDLVANSNSWGADQGWYSCGTNGAYCTCPNGSFVGQVYHESNTNLAQALQIRCWKP